MKGKVEESVITHFNGHSFDSVKSLDLESISGPIERQLKNNWAGCSRVRWAGHLTVQTHLQSFNFSFCFCLNCQPCADGKAAQNQLMGPVLESKMGTARSKHVLAAKTQGEKLGQDSTKCRRRAVCCFQNRIFNLIKKEMGGGGTSESKKTSIGSKWPFS